MINQVLVVTCMWVQRLMINYKLDYAVAGKDEDDDYDVDLCNDNDGVF